MSSNFRKLSVVFLATFTLGGCLFRTHKVEQPFPISVLKAATKPQLVAYVNSQAAKIQTMQATVDIATSVGGVKKGKVTEYQEIRGYVLARKPAMLRMIGLLPIVRNRAFDMVSDGQQFKVWIPAKNRFVVGDNQLATPNPQQPLENLRPQAIYDALLLRSIDSENEFAMLEDSTETMTADKGRKYEQPDYVLDIVRSQGDEHWLARKIVFSRIDLLPDRQLIYDQAGTLVTDARYSKYQDYNGVLFPARIEIRRPEEEYDITLNIVKMDMNLPLTDDKFVLEQPPGAQVIRLGATPPPNGNGSDGGGSH
jgi:outer membrane lipoprotein-sorting protein